MRPKKRWLFGYVWLFGYFVTIRAPGGFRIRGINSSIRIRFVRIINLLLMVITAKKSLLRILIHSVFRGFHSDQLVIDALFFWNSKSCHQKPLLKAVIRFCNQMHKYVDYFLALPSSSAKCYHLRTLVWTVRRKCSSQDLVSKSLKLRFYPFWVSLFLKNNLITSIF